MASFEPVTRIEKLLNEIAENTSGGGGGAGLPAVTSEDNGDVLTVVNGAWAKAAPSGGGDTFDVIITSTYDETAGEDIFTCNKTVSEISAEYAAHGMNRMRASWVRDGLDILSPVSFGVGEITDHGVPLDYILIFVMGNGFYTNDLWVTSITILDSMIAAENMSFTLTPTT